MSAVAVKKTQGQEDKVLSTYVTGYEKSHLHAQL